MTVGADLYVDLLFRTLRLEDSSAGTFNHRIKNLGVNIFFHLNGLQLSILLIFHKFSTSFYLSNAAISLQLSADSRMLVAYRIKEFILLIHGVEEIPIVLGGLYLLQ